MNLTLVLPLFDNVLFFKPMPRLINFTKIFNYKIVSFNSFFALTKYPKTFWMNSKMLLIFSKILNSSQKYSSEFSISYCEFFRQNFIIFVNFDDKFQSTSDIITLLILLLNCKQQLLIHKSRLLLHIHIHRTKQLKIHGCTDIHSPRDPLRHILPKL